MNPVNIKVKNPCAKLFIRKQLSILVDWGLVILSQVIVISFAKFPIHYYLIIIPVMLLFLTNISLIITRERTLGDHFMRIKIEPIANGFNNRWIGRILFRNFFHNIFIIISLIEIGDIEMYFGLLVHIIVHIYGIFRDYGKATMIDYITKTKYILVDRV